MINQITKARDVFFEQARYKAIRASPCGSFNIENHAYNLIPSISISISCSILSFGSAKLANLGWDINYPHYNWCNHWLGEGWDLVFLKVKPCPMTFMNEIPARFMVRLFVGSFDCRKGHGSINPTGWQLNGIRNEASVWMSEMRRVDCAGKYAAEGVFLSFENCMPLSCIRSPLELQTTCIRTFHPSLQNPTDALFALNVSGSFAHLGGQGE